MALSYGAGAPYIT